jgi:hypothetical protein
MPIAGVGLAGFAQYPISSLYGTLTVPTRWRDPYFTNMTRISMRHGLNFTVYFALVRHNEPERGIEPGGQGSFGKSGAACR